MWNKKSWIVRSLSVVIFLTAGSVAAKKHIGQQGYSSAGLKISPDDDEFDHDGEKLWVKLKVENTSDEFILIDRNLIEAKAPDGKIFKRILPISGKGDAYVLPPGKTETVTMEYSSPKDVPVVLLMKGFFGLNTKPVALPNYSISLEK